MRFYFNDAALLCALGHQRSEILGALQRGDRSGLVASDEFTPGRPLYLGRVGAELPELPDAWAAYRCRNNRLLLAAARQLETMLFEMTARYGADRIGVVLGTSTSGVRNSELALQALAETGAIPAGFHYKQQQMGAGADFLAGYLGLGGPHYTVSTACSSSGKAILSARRLLDLDLCDAVLVGGADSLCGLTVNGFAALESVSKGLCRPFGAGRDGINLGEAAALFVISREPGPVALLGAAATSDAHHFSAPDPAGIAVAAAMRQALEQARLEPAQVDYLNLHGTATPLNDAMESRAVHQVFGERVPVSSSKGLTGHTLGTAAALELGFCWLLLTDANPAGALIPNVNDADADPALPELNWVRPGQTLGRPVGVCQSNSFAFGGSNVSIVVARA
ncbi:beta-ketoacyl-[acyl-carrier-protein] synthase family protein [Methylococcaceae bacterium WWC4]|nr:beta-ketoacyl-[acyl-carrier-protein] synthase family protein [Methylococcaceae bacterium WWC4]